MRNKLILDACCGGRMFHFDKQNTIVHFNDIRNIEEQVLSNRQKFSVNPETQFDFRDMPFEDETFYSVIFDPPHLTNLGDKSYMKLKYGKLNKSWKDDIRANRLHASCRTPERQSFKNALDYVS